MDPLSDVFISYDSADKKRVRSLVELMESRGWTVWWDRKIPAGGIFADVIDKAIEATKCMVVVWTVASIESRWVRNEAGEGDRRGILVPVLFDDVTVPFEFRNIEAANLKGFPASSKDTELEELLTVIGYRVQKPIRKEPVVREPAPQPTRPAPEPTPGKNILVFSDEPGGVGEGLHNTNVFKLFNLSLGRSARQISFYDRGLAYGWRKLIDNFVGRGFSKNVIKCYDFIFQNVEHGDKIFLFGFGRGAATVRSLAGFIDLFGLLPQSSGKLIKEAWKIYKIKDPNIRKKRAAEFVKFHHTTWVNVEFLGVWDTVGLLGIPNTKIDKVLEWFIPRGFHDFHLSECVRHACHALAIDDVRKDFHPVLFEPDIKENQTLRQVWFIGMRCDVGGGYMEQELSDIALEWIVQYAVRHGLLIYKPKERKSPARLLDPNGKMHNSRDKFWERAIFKGKPRDWDQSRFGRAVVHESVVLRSASIDNKADGGYKPWILSQDPDIERWTHSSDLKRDPAFADEDVQKSLEALEGWCGTKEA